MTCNHAYPPFAHNHMSKLSLYTPQLHLSPHSPLQLEGENANYEYTYDVWFRTVNCRVKHKSCKTVQQCKYIVSALVGVNFVWACLCESKLGNVSIGECVRMWISQSLGMWERDTDGDREPRGTQHTERQRQARVYFLNWFSWPPQWLE